MPRVPVIVKSVATETVPTKEVLNEKVRTKKIPLSRWVPTVSTDNEPPKKGGCVTAPTAPAKDKKPHKKGG